MDADVGLDVVEGEEMCVVVHVDVGIDVVEDVVVGVLE